MFSDIEGSTEMTERLGDQKWMEVLREHNKIVRRNVKAHGGFEVKSEGDGFMLAFQSARRGLECAIAIQRAFAERNEKAEEPVQVRVGLHAGETIKDGEDFFGKNVVLAARIASQAQGGEILVSALLKELTESAGEFAFGDGREVELKGRIAPGVRMGDDARVSRVLGGLVSGGGSYWPAVRPLSDRPGAGRASALSSGCLDRRGA